MPAAASSLGRVSARVGGELRGDPGTRLTDVTHDARQAGPGVLFAALRGAVHDGHRFVSEAVSAGSPAVAVESPQDVSVSQLIVEDTRAALGPISAEVHGDPSHQVSVVGVTGTNGKTTVAHFVEALLVSSGRTAGLIGTVETRVGATAIDNPRTTPEATDFQRILAMMRDLDAFAVAAEISSHALELERVKATKFAVAAFTNLSRDHLDFHGTMEAYRRSKERLFRDYEVGTAVVNVDDQVGADIVGWAEMPVVTVGRAGEVRADSITGSWEGTSFRMVTPQGGATVNSPLIAGFNVENALIAAGCCLSLGLTMEEVVAGVSSLHGVPGRFERVSVGPIDVVVDYAHTPDGIEHAIAVARSLTRGKVIAVVGAGGDRDREKRPLMGGAAARADLAVLTSDNPRSEDPASIVADVAAGAGKADVVIEIDRRAAIERAIATAVEGDVVLILGKGHEPGQEIAGEVLPFDDRAVAREVLAAGRSSARYGPDSGSMTS